MNDDTEPGTFSLLAAAQDQLSRTQDQLALAEDRLATNKHRLDLAADRERRLRYALEAVLAYAETMGADPVRRMSSRRISADLTLLVEGELKRGAAS